LRMASSELTDVYGRDRPQLDLGEHRPAARR
jgi:hypothetical protein